MSRAFFEQVVEALVGFLPAERRTFSSRVSSINAKVWFGSEPKEHYEVQALRAGGARVLEIGFHAEHSDPGRSESALGVVLAGEASWRPALGAEVETGSVVGGGTGWRRASEIWDGVDLDDPATAVDAADRLASYIVAFEPLRH